VLGGTREEPEPPRGDAQDRRGTVTAPLSPKQASEDAISALLAAGFGKDRGRPVRAESWPLRYSSRPQDDWMRTEVTVAARLADEALRALLTVPGGILVDVSGGTVTLIRDRALCG
jgi:hypothetical protein